MKRLTFFSFQLVVIKKKGQKKSLADHQFWMNTNELNGFFKTFTIVLIRSNLVFNHKLTTLWSLTAAVNYCTCIQLVLHIILHWVSMMEWSATWKHAKNRPALLVKAKKRVDFFVFKKISFKLICSWILEKERVAKLQWIRWGIS